MTGGKVLARKQVSQLGAVGLALAGYTFWVLADTSLKIAGSSRLPVYEVVAGVGLATVLLMVLFALVRGNLASLRPKDVRAQVLRSCLDLANNVCVVIALRHLPLPLFYILVFFAPIVTTLLAAVFLGERLEWQKGIAIVTGFLGVVVAVNPFGARAGDGVGYLACLICVAAFSVNIVWTRRMTQTETPESLILFSGLMQVVVGGAAMLWHAVPVPARMTGVLTACALFCVLGSLCFLIALRSAAAATVSQFHYSQLLTGALLAWLIWGEQMTRSMVAGAVLIIGAGLYTAARSYAVPVEKEAG